jgi:hypothetical protein
MKRTAGYPGKFVAAASKFFGMQGFERIVGKIRPDTEYSCQIPGRVERFRDKAIRGSFGKRSSLNLNGDLSGYREQIVLRLIICRYVEEEDKQQFTKGDSLLIKTPIRTLRTSSALGSKSAFHHPRLDCLLLLPFHRSLVPTE